MDSHLFRLLLYRFRRLYGDRLEEDQQQLSLFQVQRSHGDGLAAGGRQVVLSQVRRYHADRLAEADGFQQQDLLVLSEVLRRDGDRLAADRQQVVLFPAERHLAGCGSHRHLGEDFGQVVSFRHGCSHLHRLVPAERQLLLSGCEERQHGHRLEDRYRRQQVLSEHRQRQDGRGLDEDRQCLLLLRCQRQDGEGLAEGRQCLLLPAVRRQDGGEYHTDHQQCELYL